MKKYLVLITLIFIVSCTNRNHLNDNWFYGSWIADLEKTRTVYDNKASAALAVYNDKTISVNEKHIIITAIHPEIRVSDYVLSSSKENLVVLSSEIGEYQFGNDSTGVYILTKVIPLKISNVTGNTSVSSILDVIRHSEEGDPKYFKVYMKRI